MKKQASFTLLELLISCFLLGVILTFLLTFFRQNLCAKQTLHTTKEKALQVELFKLRLQHLFNGLNEADGGFVKTLTHAQAKGLALLISADQGIDIHPSLSGKGYSMLFKTEDERLCLCHWSKEKRPRIDTLLCGVSDFSLSFFSEGSWYPEWPKNKKSHAPPSLLKLSLKWQKEPEAQDFFFFLPGEAEAIEI